MRLLIALIPVIGWFIWKEIARRAGRPMGSTPWAWLVAAGLVLMVLSLLVTGAMQPDNRDKAYVPTEVGAEGQR